MSAKENADYLMQYAQQHGITDSKELANFMGQMQVESGGYVRMEESLAYSAKRLIEVFPGRNGMDTQAEANTIAAGGQEAVANQIYGGAWGKRNLGNTEPGDGWRFHGRGYVQLTGRDSYETVGEGLGLDLMNHPELASERENAARIAVHYWSSRVVPNGHQKDVDGACVDINGGTNGLADRRSAAAAWQAALDKGYVAGGPDPLPQHGDGGQLRDSVLHVQQLLNRNGYHDSEGKLLSEDGNMGAKTRHAIEAFQRDHNLKADGVAGPATLRAMEGRQRETHGAVPTGHSLPETLRYGSRGADVRELQATLATHGYRDGQGHAITPDGRFGARTDEALRAFQRDHGLKVDGIAGQATLAALRTAQPATPRLDNSAHPDHEMHQQALAKVHELDVRQGRTTDDVSRRFAGSLTAAARAGGLTRIDHVVLSDDGSRAWAVKGELNSPLKQLAEVDTKQAVSVALEESSRRAVQAETQHNIEHAAQQQNPVQPERLPLAL